MANVRDNINQIEKQVYNNLKNFQQKTVDRVYELFESETKRVLVSDEVGLGKTLIAKGVIAKFAKMRKEKYNDDLVKVVYVCSNSAIVEQNLIKLRISDDIDIKGSHYSRLSMQHLRIFQQENDPNLKDKYIQFIPLTPDTSFRFTKGYGMASERALICSILVESKIFKGYEKKLSAILQASAKNCDKWNELISEYVGKIRECNNKSCGEYFKYMFEQLKNRDCLNDLLDIIVKEDYIEKGRKLISKIRLLFSEIGIDRLEPDLVIMDEFQRFKDLLADDETNLLANKFFNNSNPQKMPWILLLSATPYKMYSTLEEIDENNVDEHYNEFFNVLDFLYENNKTKMHEFKNLWENYSIRLKEYTNGDYSIIQIKKNAEDELYKNICRTERLNSIGSVDIVEDVNSVLKINDKDIKSYLDIEQLILDNKGIQVTNIPIDYVKSCPYLLSFMKDYKLKQDIEKFFRKNPEIADKLRKKDTLFINKNTIREYKPISWNNAKLQYTMDKVFEQNSELLLWVPPSKPYYNVYNDSPYKNIKSFTKTLIFSSWEMVPRMLSTLISYEMERKNVDQLKKIDDYYKKDNKLTYFRDDKKRYPLPKLSFEKKKGGEPGSMNLLCLIYPSLTLADFYNPIDCLNKKMTLKQIEKQIEKKVYETIKQYNFSSKKEVDKKWYYMLPFILDGKENVRKFAESYKEYLDVQNVERKDALRAHIETIINICNNFDSIVQNLGNPPRGFEKVVRDMVISSPAICFLRAFKARFDDFDIKYPALLANAFLRKINIPEATAVIEICSKNSDKEAFWMNLLNYCKNGNFQSMVDEYMHLLANCSVNKDRQAAKNIFELFFESLSIRSTPYSIDTFETFKKRVGNNPDNYTDNKKVLIRTHFAVSFTKGEESGKSKKTAEEDTSDRKKVVRNAFNSPFRPFVLASTSIGQEGLDFHNYCRRIVHWNLPANPIDLEQREGRINRFESLVIRQNIAARYGNMEFQKDVWGEMFKKAEEKECNEETSELVPYWGLTDQPNMPKLIKIERIIPKYPFSRDESYYLRLMKILSLYRLTLGQTRQEELIEYLFKNSNNSEELKKLFINLSPYYKEDKT